MLRCKLTQIALEAKEFGHRGAAHEVRQRRRDTALQVGNRVMFGSFWSSIRSSMAYAPPNAPYSACPSPSPPVVNVCTGTAAPARRSGPAPEYSPATQTARLPRYSPRQRRRAPRRQDHQARVSGLHSITATSRGSACPATVRVHWLASSVVSALHLQERDKQRRHGRALQGHGNRMGLMFGHTSAPSGVTAV